MTPQDALSGFDVSRETTDKLKAYVALIEKWNPAINLISKASMDQIWQRHIADSLQVASLMTKDQQSWADLGAGGGLPGLVVAILASEKAPGLSVDLVEVDQRKSVFLRQVAAALDLKVQVHTRKIEDLSRLGAEVVSARALAPLSTLCGYAMQHLRPEGMAIFPKGAQFATEVSEARKLWSFDLEEMVSVTEPLARILILRAIKHA